jgi:hypothetical protein
LPRGGIGEPKFQLLLRTPTRATVITSERIGFSNFIGSMLETNLIHFGFNILILK